MKLKTGAAFLLMAVMLIAALCIGAWKGWRGEAELAMERRAALEQMLEIRAECAHNVLVVAKRHLPDTDARVQAVEAAWRALSGDNTLSDKARAHAALTQDAKSLLEGLAALESVQQDPRDRMYAENYLPQMLLESQSSGAAESYHQAAVEFNQGLAGSFSGMLARLFGMQPMELFQ